MSHREDVKEMSEFRGLIWRFLPMVLMLIVLFSGLGFVTHSLGLWGGTIVERKVFEESYQRSEALKSQLAVDEAVVAEINRKLTNPNLDEDTRHSLEAQKSAANIRIATTRSKQ